MRAIGYIRVSSKGQAEEGESLPAQKASIETFVKAKGWQLVGVYAEEGISGRSMDKRKELKRLLKDAQDGAFDVVVISRITRFGRNTLDTLNNAKMLKDLNIKLISLAEMLDFDTPMGKMVLTMLAGFAELENEMRTEQIMAGKLETAKKRPISGRMPFGRTFDKDKGIWVLDKRIARLLRQAAKEYLSGKLLSTISNELVDKHQLKLKYGNLVMVLRSRCGDKWTTTLNGESFTYDIPRILDEDTINAIRARLHANRTVYNKEGLRKYLLSGFIRCGDCGKALTGQTQEGKRVYYKHPGRTECKQAIFYVPAPAIEKAVIKLIFEHTKDEVGFEKATTDLIPRKKEVEELGQRIADNKGELKLVEKNLKKLVDLVLAGKIREDTVKEREDALYITKAQLEAEIERDQARLDRLPNVEFIKRRAKQIRQQLQRYYQSKDRMQGMSFDEKRSLLRWLFPDGLDEHGEPYRVSVRKLADGIFDYSVNAALFAEGKFLRDGESKDVLEEITFLGTFN